MYFNFTAGLFEYGTVSLQFPFVEPRENMVLFSDRALCYLWKFAVWISQYIANPKDVFLIGL